MQSEILCVGSELLLGQIVDTNAAYIGTQLARFGINLRRKQTVGDNLERIIRAIRSALENADVLIITGGLGPTTDDLTREAIAKAFDEELELRPELESELREFFTGRNYKFSESNLRQAYQPQSAKHIPNPNGTAPGVWMQKNGKMVFAMPGVPHEMRAMLDGFIIPAIQEFRGETDVLVSRVLRTHGIGESALAELVEDISLSSENPTVAPLIYRNTEVHLRMTAKAQDEDAAKVLLDEMEKRLRERVGDYAFGIDDQTLPSVLLDLLKEREATLVVAESVTGGLLEASLTDIPGASEVVHGGVVVYTNEMKKRLLNVPAETLDKYTAVSAETAIAMAEGIRALSNADYAISTTGEAGPESQSGAKVGTVFVGIASAKGTFSEELQITGDRDRIRKRSVLAAINVLRQHIQNTE
ncbi:MAG: competence/damage-inducible protein A [Abditibacteriaceae bacterium]